MTTALQTLRQDFVGSVIEPGLPDYDTSRRTPLAWGSPDVVLRPADTADVQRAVGFVTAERMPLAVRGGGHSFAGFGTRDSGAVLDLSRLADIEVDPGPGRVRVGGGATWAQVASALAPHDLVISSGDTASVGVAGLTLSGGVGWLVRQHGLTLDSLRAAEVVTADGTLVTVDAGRHPDLFWALRGGGGNFGIVTSFEFQASRGAGVWFGRIAFPSQEASRILPTWAQYMRTAPPELTSIVDLANPFAGGREAPVAVQVAVHGEDPAAADRAIEPIRRLGTVVADDVAPHRYADILEDGALLPPGLRISASNAFVTGPEAADAMEILARRARDEMPPAITVRSLGGAVSQVPREATAFAHRSAEFVVVLTAAGPGPVVDAAQERIGDIWQELAPHVDGAYANFLSTATPADVAAVYPPDTLGRLARIKRDYDPENLFSGSHNIAPAPEPALR
ncbi:FAD-binding oxidoreductase [Occultella glacieicola]|uniref:FAD-binding oxidoreductase n=1 Tax=Occultella glacieicola TaxID=2518684 RepID=A0ABY2E759_9MICO|nr:FAD-binding oxidoreductase [Occultella glacieicola]TDE94146.1 FAD-binding oxidoreductase [Occultella glacieicola]